MLAELAPEFVFEPSPSAPSPPPHMSTYLPTPQSPCQQTRSRCRLHANPCSSQQRCQQPAMLHPVAPHRRHHP